jgi:AmmeMemoRadiSam system protein A
VSAAVRDHRFAPLTPEELPQVTIEVSVLSPLRELGHPLEVEVGRHGLYIIGGNQHGVLLPQVAVEQGWDKRSFLEAACMKAGLMASSWEMIGTRVFVFTAQIISEESISQ